MAVIVETPGGNGVLHQNATGWHVDDNGLLFVRLPEDNAGKRMVVATYADGAWVQVCVEDEAAPA